MSKDQLKHSLDELFSDFSPPTPEGEVEPSNPPPHNDAHAVVGDIPQEPIPPRDDTPRQRVPYETEPPPEKETPSGQKENVSEGKDVDEDKKVDPEDDSSPEDNISTWRAGWRNLASENTNGKGRTDSVKGSIRIRRRRLADGKRKSGEGEL